jgi:hypothetical protein
LSNIFAHFTETKEPNANTYHCIKTTPLVWASRQRGAPKTNSVIFSGLVANGGCDLSAKSGASFLLPCCRAKNLIFPAMAPFPSEIGQKIHHKILRPAHEPDCNLVWHDGDEGAPARSEGPVASEGVQSAGHEGKV